MHRLTLRNTAIAAPGRRRVPTVLAGAAALCVAGLAAAPVAGAATPAHTATPAHIATAAHAATSVSRGAGGLIPSPLPPPQSTLTQITSFGTNPTGLQMWLYVPQNVRPHPAVVVAMHYCGGSGPAFFNGTEYASLADVYGYVVIYPSVERTTMDCFDVSTPGDLTHKGDSDAVGIVSMVRWAEHTLHADRHRVFATGISSGAMMTNVLLGDYPNVFAAGSAMSGVAFGCFATTDGTLWNSDCANGLISKTPQQWGDEVRAADPHFHGVRPRMQLWHGTADTILFYPNFGEEVKEWTNVLHATPAVVDHPQPTWTHTLYTDRFGRPEVDAYSVQGEDHNLGFHFPDWAQIALQWFGIAPSH